jgi:uncharacterized membrane protein
MAFFLGITAVSLTVAGSFALAGYWPILPFAGLELAGLGAALRWSMRQGGRRELIRVDERTVSVCKSGGRHERAYEFPRPWTRVELVRARNGHWPSRLLLGAMGRRVEIGAFLTDSERDGLGRRLRQVIEHRD